MTSRLDISKVVYGAFLVPWIHRKSFARALAVPLALLASLAVCSHYLGGRVPQSFHWVLYIAYWIVFTLFAVTCHRLVLLDTTKVAQQWLPQWSMRQTRFLLLFGAMWLILFMANWPVMTILANLMLNIPGPWRDLAPEDRWQWAFYVGQVGAFYLSARFCVAFPATALDRKVNFRWAWQLTRQNGWRLVLVVGALPWFISQMVGFVYRGNATTLEAIAITFFATALFAVEISAVSLAYRELIKVEATSPMSGDT